MVKESCFRCKRPVYPTDKVGPLKDGTFFHHGCFKCYICGTRLTLKSYCHNRNNIEDQEVYCSSHAPQANPHDPVPHRSNLLGSPGGRAVPDDRDRPLVAHEDNQNQKLRSADIGDIRIQHALKATEIQKPYPKIVHSGAKYVVDYDQQTRLELIHREEEDDLYQAFSRQREEEERRLTNETKEEWEKALSEFARRYEKESQKGSSDAREDLIRKLTLKRDKRKETMRQKLKEKERAMTAELVEKQSKEMMDLFRKARLQQHFEDESSQQPQNSSNGHFGTSFSVTKTSSVSTTVENGRRGSTNGFGREGSDGSVSYPSTPPPPFPPTNRKKDVCSDVSVFTSIDQTAISVAQSEVYSFTDLMRALTHNCKNDVEKARAIYRWITVKNLNVMEFDHRIDPNTPLGILRGIKYGTESYHVLFKRLCSYAGLHCVVIKGFSKSAGYQPGLRFEDNRFRNTWNAVYLEHSWRFVQCNWGARHLVNARDVPSPAGGVSDNLRYEYDDHYFMTDPEEFIYEFFPNQPDWQLLKRPVSLDEFENLPFVRSLFFRYGLGFADPDAKSVVVADKTGAATVAINAPPETASTLIFHYNLRFYENEAQECNELDGVNLKRFVMQSTVGRSSVFRVHAPRRGDFLLDVFANAASPGEYLAGRPMKFKSVCKFKVACPRLGVLVVPLPDCAGGEWGPAKAFRSFGLTPLTHEDAIVNSGPDLEVKFRMTRPLVEFAAALRKNGVDDRKLSKLVQHSIRGDSVSFRISFREEGQYGLDVYAREGRSDPPPSIRSPVSAREDPDLLTHCCKYLINART